MRIISCSVTNFGSYPKLEVSFDFQGPVLVYGKTGAGKSTIMDAASWCLFGQTAKGGSVDDIKSWFTDEDTTGEIEVELNGEFLTISRTRGKSNDLYFVKKHLGEPQRGKTISDTQNIINSILGFDFDTYTTSAYFHEFSPTQTFFSAKAKDRRELFERLSNLVLPNKLTLAASEERKKTKVKLSEQEMSISRVSGSLEALRSELSRVIKSSDDWEKLQAKKIIQLQDYSKNFEHDKNEKILMLELESEQFTKNKTKAVKDLAEQIEKLKKSIRPDEVYTITSKLLPATKSVCPTCSQAIEDPRNAAAQENNEKLRRQNEKNIYEKQRLEDKLDNELDKVDPWGHQIEIEKSRINTFGDEILRAKRELNPFTVQYEDVTADIKTKETLFKGYSSALDELRARISGLNQLLDLSGALRAELLKNAVQCVEDTANTYLEKYFDSEIRISLIVDQDALETSIQCHGYACNYKQLSKGQRGLLKLCFGVSVMKEVANNSGIHFYNLMFDESLDGLDHELKVKAFTLFESLAQEHDNIVIIDHYPEFQSKFENKLHVTMENDVSKIESC